MTDLLYQSFDFVTYLSICSIVFPLSLCIYNYANLSSLQKLIGLLVLVTILGELGSNWAAEYYKNNIPVFHLFTLIQFTLFTFIMEKGLHPWPPKIIFKCLRISFIIFALLDAFWWNGINNFNNYARPLSSILLICFALTFFYKTLKELQIKNLESVPLFWLSIGVLIYYSGSLLIFLFTNYVKSSDAALYTIWGIHAIFNIILNISYFIALWVKPPN